MSIAYKLFYTYQNLQSVHILCTYQLGLVSNVCKMIFDRVKLTSKSLRNKSTLKIYFSIDPWCIISNSRLLSLSSYNFCKKCSCWSAHAYFSLCVIPQSINVKAYYWNHIFWQCDLLLNLKLGSAKGRLICLLGIIFCFYHPV